MKLLLKNPKYLKIAALFAVSIGMYSFFLIQKSVIRDARIHDQKDFPAYYIASKLSSERKDIYNLENIKKTAEDNGIAFVDYRANLYPPPFSVMAGIFSGLSLYRAQEAFIIIKILLLLTLAALFPFAILNSDIYKEKLPSEKFWLIVFISGLNLGLFSLNSGIVADIRDGQINILIGFLILIAAIFENKFPTLSGGFIALGGSIKLSPYFFVLKFICEKRIRAILGFSAATIILFAISLYYFGYSIHEFYFQKIFIPFFSEEHIPILNWPLAHSQNQSFRGIFYRLFVSDYSDQISGTAVLFNLPWLAKLLTSLFNFFVVALCGIIAYRAYKTKNPWANFFTYSLFISASLLTSPLTWFHHLAILAFPLCVVLTYIILEKNDNYKLIFIFLFINFLLFLPPLFLYQGTRMRGYSFLNYIKLFANSMFFLFIVKLYFDEEKKARQANTSD